MISSRFCSPRIDRKNDANGKISTLKILSLLMIGLVSGALIVVAVKSSYDIQSASIGEIGTKNDLVVGAWFRYDFKRWNDVENQFYIIANITSVTSAGALDGEPTVAEKLGEDERWYTWDLRAYWLDGVEAVSLYGNPNTGNYLWDAIGYNFFKGYQLRNTVNSTQVSSYDSNNLLLSIYRVFRPLWLTSRNINFNYQRLQDTSFVDAKLEGIFTFGYQGTNNVPSNSLGGTSNDKRIFVNYEKDTGILTWVQSGQYPSYIFMYLSGWSNNASVIPIIDPDSFKTRSPVLDVVPNIEGHVDYDLLISGDDYDFLYVNATSSNETAIKSFKIRTFSNDIPINVVGENTTVRFDVIGVKEGVKSDLTTKICLLSDLASPNSTSTSKPSASATNDTIILTWSSVINASDYLIYLNGSFLDLTKNTYYYYHPSSYTPADYEFFIVSRLNDGSNVISNAETISWAPSVVNVRFGPDDGGRFLPEMPSDLTGVIIFMIIGVAMAVVIAILLYQYRKNGKFF